MRCGYMTRMVRVLIGLFLVFMLQPPVVAIPGTTDEIIVCNKAFSAAYFCDVIGNCSMKHKFGAVHVVFTQQCVRGLLACQIKGEKSGTDQTQCFEGAYHQCEKILKRLRRKEKTWFSRHRDRILRRCGDLPFEDDILSTNGGIGYSNNEQTCSDIGIPLGSVEDIINCSDTWFRCEAEKLIAALNPRAREALEDAGLEESFSPAGCMEPAVSGDASGVKMQGLLTCQKAIQDEASRFLKQKMVNLQKCVDEVFRCKIKEEPGELSGEAFQSCSDEAAALCDARLDKVAALEDTTRTKILRRCRRVNVNDLSNALGFKPPAQCSGAATTEELITCLVDVLEEWVDRVVQELKPRASEFFNDVGY